MGIYLNPGTMGFKTAINSKIYVDKTNLIAYTNSVLNTESKYICVSRPRRFGKTITLNMLAAYYGQCNHSKELFADFKIAKDESFAEYINKFDVIFINMIDFLTEAHNNVEKMLADITDEIVYELQKLYPECYLRTTSSLAKVMNAVYAHSGRQFIILLDEWDAVFRELQENEDSQEYYLDFLRNLLKNKDYIALAYMTGILPIKKYGKHSALNMFREYSMENAGPLTEFTGFTDDEVKELCCLSGLNYAECKRWYDGYRLSVSYKDYEKGGFVEKYKIYEIYNPLSVVLAIEYFHCDNYWNKTETYEALKRYIVLDMEGLKSIVLQLLAGSRRVIEIKGFSNDMITFHGVDDVLALLVHLGYLAYDRQTQEVYIPNNEIRDEFLLSISAEKDWSVVTKAVKASNDLLKATWEKDEVYIAKAIDEAHLETSILQYNDENALSYVIALTYYAARNYYSLVREMPAGKGFADMVFRPLDHHKDKPAIIVELKWDESAETALKQIKDRQYVKALDGYYGKVLLVGISYGKDSQISNYKHHKCVIEEIDF